jgi:LEA14-like dessication related protein
MVVRKRCRPSRHVVAVLGLAMLMGACVHLQAPAVNLVAVELADVQLDEQHFKVRLHVENPNDRPLPIKSVSCTLQVEGVEVGEGRSAGPFIVPAGGEADFDALVTTNVTQSLPSLLPRLLSIVLQNGEMPAYHVSGWVNPDIALVPPIPFSHSGKIAIPPSVLNLPLSPGT